VTNPTSGSLLQIRTCDKYDPVSGAPCTGNPLKPNHYLDCPNTISPGTASTFSFNGDTQYIAFALLHGPEVAELWPTSSGAWPKTYTIKPSAIEDLLQTETTAVLHYIQPTTSHCEDIIGDTTSAWWKANGWKYSSWTQGKCPAKYNFVNEVDHPAARVTHRTLGIHTKPKPQYASFAQYSTSVRTNDGSCDPTGYVHAIGTDGGDKGKCLEIAFGGGKLQSKFWAAEGWKYSKPIGKMWSDGRCDRVAFPSVSSLTKDYNGWTDDKNAGYAGNHCVWWC